MLETNLVVESVFAAAPAAAPDAPPPDGSSRFLTALFTPEDLVLLRPIETWTEDGKKQSRVAHKKIVYRHAEPMLLAFTMEQQLRWSADERLNVFFGVCPRLGDKGRFDLAWQIRKVPALWTDIDHCTEEEALERCAAAGLPPPSIVVKSGHGVHLYWLLDHPYLIKDAGDPPPVLTEWIEKDGKQKPRRYFVDDHGEQIGVQQRHSHPKLSAQAQLVQDVLSGIAAKIDGDHTTDLTRLLRVPGTLNRKDQRNGREPVPCTLSRCDSSCRYPFDSFRSLAAESPDVKRRATIAAMPIKRVGKLSTAKLDKLEEWVARCAVAETGTRSEADFGLCCFALRQGIAQDEVWSRVQTIGKFAESGEDYFQRTWGRAEESVRTDTYQKLAKLDQTQQSAGMEDDDSASQLEVESDSGQTSSRDCWIKIDPVVTPVATTMRQITNVLLGTKTAYSRAGQCVVLRGDDLAALMSNQELAGHLNQHVEFRFIEGEEGAFKPLPPNYGNTWLHNASEMARLPELKLYSRNPVYTSDWRLVAPGFDAQSGIYYSGQVVEARQGTSSHLDALLRDFCFKSLADRTNFIGILLTAILVPQFIGAKPAALFNGNQPGLGKSILAQIIAILRDGRSTETASYNANDEEFEKRLGSVVRRGTTTIIIDNAKGQGRKPRIESACLERSITDPVLSYRLLGKSQEIRAENSHIFCITANTPDVSPDLVSRSVVINLEYEGDPKRRAFHVADPEGYAEQHRYELLGELVGMVERWKAAGMPRASVHTRFNKRGWGDIVGGILQVNGEPDFLSNADEAAAQLDDTRREFAELVAVLADHSQGNWTATELVELCRREGLLAADLGEGSPKSLSTKLGTLAGRYIDERFGIADGRIVLFRRSKERKGNLYRVAIVDEVPNLGPIAEPLPNHLKVVGSAP